MTLLFKTGLALLASIPLPRPSDDAKPPGADAVYAAIGGRWEGTLEYRDYSNDKRVKLPTTLEARPAEDRKSVALRFRYDEGKKRFVESFDTIRIEGMPPRFFRESGPKKSRSEYAIAGLAELAAKGRGTLVLTGEGVENDRKVEVRETIALDGENLTILKESRLPDLPFAFRNQYTFRKAVAKAP